MTTPDLLTTTQVAARLGLTRQAVLARVKAGTLAPSYTQPANRGYLFDQRNLPAAA